MELSRNRASILFEHKKSARSKRLEDYPIVKCVEGEKILCAQKQHEIAFIIPLGIRALIFIFVLLLLFATSFSLNSILPINNSLLFLYLIAVLIPGFLLIEIYNFLSWYYEFYIITNKSLIHRYCFRISGPYSEAVFGEKMHIQDMRRDAQNAIYDFLKIQDVFIYFHQFERSEPFVFRTPKNAQRIEDVIQDLIIQSRNYKR